MDIIDVKYRITKMLIEHNELLFDLQQVIEKMGPIDRAHTYHDYMDKSFKAEQYFDSISCAIIVQAIYIYAKN